MSEEITYTRAFEELQEIVAEMENSEITIDELDGRIKRASELLKICKDKLFSTEKKCAAGTGGDKELFSGISLGT